MVGRVGVDPFATMLLARLDADGVGRRFVLEDVDAGTGVADIVVDDDGGSSIIVAPRANGRLSPSDVAAAGAALARAAVVVLQLEIPIAAVTEAAERARSAGRVVVLNAAPAPERALPDALLRCIDVLIVNQTELGAMAGRAVSDAESAAVALRGLTKLGAGALVVTLGEAGALVAPSKDAPIFEVPAFPVEVVDTTGAGDAFVGALAASLARGEPLADAVRRGAAAGALACTRLGAEPSLPHGHEIDALLAGS
jgi:ribokinase